MYGGGGIAEPASKTCLWRRGDGVLCVCCMCVVCVLYVCCMCVVCV